MKYRKKPIVIEAFQMTRERRDSNADWPEWLHKAWQLGRFEEGSVSPYAPGTDDRSLGIMMLEGEVLVAWNDFIIQGVKGEIYPCKPDIFEATHDAVEAPCAEELSSP